MDEYAESTLIARESEVSQKVSETHRPIESPRRIAFLMYFGGGEEHVMAGTGGEHATEELPSYSPSLVCGENV